MTDVSQSAGRRFFLTLAPLPMLGLILIAGLATVALTLLLATRGPWLGVGVDAAGAEGVRIVAIDPAGPAKDQLEVGQTVHALLFGFAELPLEGHDPEKEPHTLPRFEDYQSYLSHQGLINEALSGERAVLLTEDGPVSMQPEDGRPVSSLPLEFWLFHLFGLIALMISAAAWVFRREERPPAYLALSGLGFFIATASHSVWVSRELALPEVTFDTLLRINHVGLALLLAGLICFLSTYPRPLPRMRLLHGALALIVLYQVNENFQWFDLPWHTFYLPLLVIYVIAALLALNQWRMSRHDPVDRAALKWIFLSVFLSMGVGLALYFVPVLMGQGPNFPQIYLTGIAVTLYVGFALGVVRYRLFDLDQWWVLAWLWFFGGLLVVLVDLALVALFGLGHVEAVGIAVLLVAWGYLPLRSWIWSKLTGRPPRAIEEKLPGLAESIVQAKGLPSADERWVSTLHSLFNPLSLQPRAESSGAVEIRSNGAELIVPSIGKGMAFCLSHADSGSRLFSTRDRRTVESLLSVARRLYRVREAEEAGAKNERTRIIRDLHDDVGGRVLALIHSATTDRQAELARKALDALRDTIVALDDKGTISLEEALLDWHEEAMQRAEAASVELIWRNEVSALAGAQLSPRFRINLRRVLDEALTNALRHAEPTRVSVRLWEDAGYLMAEIQNDGLPDSLIERGELKPGRGLHNMRTRVDELGGSFRVSLDGEALKLAFSIPLES